MHFRLNKAGYQGRLWCFCDDFVIKNISKAVFMSPLMFYQNFINILLLFVNANSKEICQDISVYSF